MTAWDAALDSLEEWVRRTRHELVDGDAPAPDVALPTGEVPGHLRLRATVVLSQMHGLEAEAMHRRALLERARAYQQ